MDVAAQLIAKCGYEAVTMTAVAEVAGASIGTLYDYFPDKQALGVALLAQYVEEKDAYWAKLLGESADMKKSALADFFIEGLLTFMQERPAYLPLMAAPLAYSRSAAARQPLRRVIASTLLKMNRRLLPERAMISAHVIIELLKGLLAVYKQATPKDRKPVTEEFKKLMRLYLAEILD
jgi:AcrR family transcriptional regulator